MNERPDEYRLGAREEEESYLAIFEMAGVGTAQVDPSTGRFLHANPRFCEITGYQEADLLRKTFSEITHPDDRGADLEGFGRLVRGERDDYSIDKRYVRKDGSVAWVQVNVRLIRDHAGEPLRTVAVVHDITQRRQVEQELRIRHRQQSAVAGLGMLALRSNGLQSLMEDASELVARTLGVEYCKILQLLPGGEELLLRAGVGWKEGLVGVARVRAGLDSQAGYTLLSGEPVIVEDLRAEDRFDVDPLLGEHGVVSGMSVIIRCLEGPFGVLGVHTADPWEFSEDDVNFLQAMANVLGTAAEREQATEKLHEAREAERKRMSRDLHDEVLQDLSYALAAMQMARNLPENAGSRDPLERAIEAIEHAGQGVRNAVYDLQSEDDRQQGFVGLLESLVGLNRRRWPEAQIGLALETAPLPPLPTITGVELVRIVGEALSNARRHSGAHNVRVAVGSSEGKLYIEVEDDGVGFDPSYSVGTGLKGMRERALSLGANLEIVSRPAQGTRIRVVMSAEEQREEPTRRTRLLLVEDHVSYRDALAKVLEGEVGFTVVGKAGSLADARNMLDGADVAIIDLALPDGFGGDLIKELRTRNPQTQALVLSASLDRSEVARAVQSGAAGVLHKSAGMEEIMEAVRRLRRGETLMPLDEVVELLRFAGDLKDEEFEFRQAMEHLTDRERMVLQGLAEGLSSNEIAERLGISVKTERNHMSSILAKLGVHSRLQALVTALRHGVVDIS